MLVHLKVEPSTFPAGLLQTPLFSLLLLLLPTLIVNQAS